MLESVDFEVFGSVQGVFFRKFTRDKGQSLNLKGWVMRTSKGTVIGTMEGKEENVEEMKNWLRHTGSPMSKIEKCVFTNEKQINKEEFSTFFIKEEDESSEESADVGCCSGVLSCCGRKCKNKCNTKEKKCKKCWECKDCWRREENSLEEEDHQRLNESEELEEDPGCCSTVLGCFSTTKKNKRKRQEKKDEDENEDEEDKQKCKKNKEDGLKLSNVGSKNQISDTDRQSLESLFQQWAQYSSDNPEIISVFNMISWMKQSDILEQYNLSNEHIEIKVKTFLSPKNQPKKAPQGIFMNFSEFIQFMKELETENSLKDNTLINALIAGGSPRPENVTKPLNSLIPERPTKK